MLDRIRQHSQSWVAKGILFLLVLVFAVWGVETYIQRAPGADTIATADGMKISDGEYQRALRNQMDRMREAFGNQVDAATLNSPQLRQSVIDSLVNQRLLLRDAYKAGLTVTDAQLAARIAQIEPFQENGKFSKDRYTQYLRQQGLSAANFEDDFRRDMLIEQVRAGVADTTILPRTVIERFVKVAEQQREVSVAAFTPEQFTGQVNIDPTAIRKYYDAHADEFKSPERVKLEYVYLSADQLAKDVQVPAEDIEKYYKEHEKDYVQQEERQASHILITVAEAAPEAEKKAARAKAEDLLKQVETDPDKFAALAEKNSQDPGSAKQGGDLGFFARGSMVKPFEEAVFSMQKGEVRGPVESEFGMHIIKLVDIKPGRAKTLGEVTPEIQQELQKQIAGRRFAEIADTFNNMVYEQSGSLKPVADTLKLPVQKSDWVSRGTGGDDPLLNNPKLLEQVFSEKAVKEKRNTDAVEVAPNALISARVIEHKPAALKPFAEVAAAITEKLQRDEASKLATKKAQDALAQLRAGKTAAGVSWSEAKLASRQNPGDAAAEYLNAIFSADVGKLPAYIGQDRPGGGYALVRISKVVNVDKIDDAKRQSATQQLEQAYGQEMLTAAVKNLRARADIKVKQAALEVKDQ